MSATITLVSWCVALVALSSRAGGYPHPHPHPHPHRHPKGMELVDVLNKTTVCPVYPYVNENSSRIPRRIKELRCAEHGRTDRTVYDAQGAPPSECDGLNNQHGKYTMGCVQILDNVVVHYPESGLNEIIQVAVGCTCLVSLSNVGKDNSPD